MPSGWPDYTTPTWMVLDTSVCTFKEDFLAGLNVDGKLGEYGWRVNAISTGGNVVTQACTWPHLGVVTLYGGTVADSGMSLFLHRESQFGALGANAPWQSLWVFRVVAPTTKTRVRLGWVSGNPSVVQPDNGIWLRFDAAVGFADANFMLCVRKSSLESEVTYDTGVVADNAWHKLSIRSQDAGVVYMALDADAEKSFGPSGCDVTVTLPSGNLEPGFICASSDGSGQYLDCDYAAFQAWNMVR